MKTTSAENYKTSLAKLIKQLLASGFLRWWLGELTSMVPAWMRAPAVTAETFVLVTLDQANDPMVPAESSAQRVLALTLPPSRILRKSLTFPLATEENLRQVLEFQIEQHTPFTLNQVYFGYSVLERNFELGQVVVDFVATPRNAVDAAIKALSGSGSTVHAVFAANMLSDTNLVNLLPAAEGEKLSPLKQGVNPWLVALVVLLALAVMAVPPIIKREAIIQMLPWVEKAKTAAETVDGMRRELEARVEQHNYLLQKRQTLPTVIQSLEELTRIMPDGTWVQSIDLREKDVQIQGETNSSVKLIGLFEQSTMFGDASFRSPLTKANSSSNERYHLSLQMRPQVAPAPAPFTPLAAPASSVSITASSVSPVLVSSAPAQKVSENKNTAPKEGSKP